MLNTSRITSASFRLLRMMSHTASSAESAAVPWKEIRIPVPWGHIAGKEWGDANGQPVMGLHGWQDNSASFDFFLNYPITKTRFIAIDLPGHGQSSHIPPGKWYKWSDYVATVARVADYLNWDQFSLIGHSMGAKVSFIYAGCFPERVKRLVSLEMVKAFRGLSTVLFNPPADVKADWKANEVYRDWIQHLLKIEKQCQRNSQRSGRTMEQLIDKVMTVTNNQYFVRESARIILKRGTRLVSKDPDLYELTRDRRLEIYDFYMADEHYNQICKRIICDVLIIHASKGIWFYNPHVDASIYDEFRKQLKVFQVLDVEGLHHVHLNNPERVVPILEKFLNVKNS